jgi:hypothetical protein
MCSKIKLDYIQFIQFVYFSPQTGQNINKIYWDFSELQIKNAFFERLDYFIDEKVLRNAMLSYKKIWIRA